MGLDLKLTGETSFGAINDGIDSHLARNRHSLYLPLHNFPTIPRNRGRGCTKTAALAAYVAPVSEENPHSSNVFISTPQPWRPVGKTLTSLRYAFFFCPASRDSSLGIPACRLDFVLWPGRSIYKQTVNVGEGMGTCSLIPVGGCSCNSWFRKGSRNSDRAREGEPERIYVLLRGNQHASSTSICRRPRHS